MSLIVIVYIYSENVSHTVVHDKQSVFFISVGREEAGPTRDSFYCWFLFGLITTVQAHPTGLDTRTASHAQRTAVAPPCATVDLVAVRRRMGGVVVLCASVLLGVITATDFFRVDAADAATARTKVIPTVRNDCKRPSTMFQSTITKHGSR